MNEHEARLRQAKLHEVAERVAQAEERERRVRLFDFARWEVIRAKRLVEEGLGRDRADERTRGLDESIILADEDELLEDEGVCPGGSDYERKRESALLRDYRMLLDLRRDPYRSMPGEDPPESKLYLGRFSYFPREIVVGFGDYGQGRWGPCEALRQLNERGEDPENELEEAKISVSGLSTFKVYARHTKEHEPEKYARIAGLARMVEEGRGGTVSERTKPRTDR